MENKIYQCESDMIRLWTAQSDPVISCIQKDGRSLVKKEYIDKKYGESAWVFQTAYGFFREYGATLLPKPAGAESPFWLFPDPKWIVAGKGSFILELLVPRSRVLLFEREKWQKILNLSYLGNSEEEEEHFHRELEAQGLSTSFEVFSTPFYPALRAKIRKSWERLFTLETEEKEALQAALWEIRKEDIISCRKVT